jgi:hypothetical protein
VFRVYLFTCVRVYVFTRLCHNSQHNFIGLRRIFGAVDGDSVFNETRDELVKIFVEALDHVRADEMGVLSPRLPIGQGL